MARIKIVTATIINAIAESKPAVMFPRDELTDADVVGVTS